MLWLERTLPTLEENLALDEALLLDAEAGGPELLRTWTWPHLAVVLGAGGRWREETHADICQHDGVTIRRRSSGGGTVLLGPGCLLFSLVLSFDRDPMLADIHGSYRYILGCMTDAFRRFVPGVRAAGISDLAVGERKFSGNSQQRKRHHVLHHGTLLYDFELTLIERYLATPPRMPDYRRQRTHLDFVANLSLPCEQIVACLREAWPCNGVADKDLSPRVNELLAEKYGRTDWHERR